MEQTECSETVYEDGTDSVPKLPMKMEQSFPKRRHIKFRSQGITQNKAHNVHNTAKV